MMKRVLVGLVLLAALGRPTVPAAQAGPTASPVTYEIFAVRFGVLPQFPVANLVAGGDQDRKLDIPVMVWVLKGSDGRVVLIDSGFYEE